MLGIGRFLKKKRNIFDVGSGVGSEWWQQVDKLSTITGIDNNFFPKKTPNNVKLYKLDASKLGKLKQTMRVKQYLGYPERFSKTKVCWFNKFDLVVANHVLEHVESPLGTIKGIFKLLKSKGVVYIGFPEATNFTDIFYHLIHSDGGGHIQKLTKDQVVKMFIRQRFSLVSCSIWPDDWLWFEKCFNYKAYGIKHITPKEISYLASVFRKELTKKKGYFYGWEMVFRKK